jgi:hypothetical protein
VSYGLQWNDPERVFTHSACSLMACSLIFCIEIDGKSQNQRMQR